MKIVVIDGQGGRMGSAFIDKWIKSGGDAKELIADPEKPGYVRRNDTL